MKLKENDRNRRRRSSSPQQETALSAGDCVIVMAHTRDNIEPAQNVRVVETRDPSAAVTTMLELHRRESGEDGLDPKNSPPSLGTQSPAQLTESGQSDVSAAGLRGSLTRTTTTTMTTTTTTCVTEEDRILPSPGAFSVPGPGFVDDGDDGPDSQPRHLPSSSSTPSTAFVDDATIRLVVAEVVDEREREEAMRNRILSSAVVAQRVVTITASSEEEPTNPSPLPSKRRRRGALFASLALVGALLVVSGAVVAAVVTTGRNQSQGPNRSPTGLNNTLTTEEATTRPNNSSNTSSLGSGKIGWTALGAPINLSAVEAPDSYQKLAVLSEDGKVFAVAYSDRVKLYRYVARNGTWVCMDRVLLWKLNHSAAASTTNNNNDGTSDGGSDDGYNADSATYSMALSSEGTRIALSDPGFLNGTGRVHVLEYDPDQDEWIAMAGTPLDGNLSRDDGGADRFGHDVKLSSDGTVLAVAASNYRNGDSYGLSDRGYVSVFALKNASSVGNNEWTLVDRMPGISSPSELSLALSGNGGIVAIGDARDAMDPGTVRSWKCLDENLAADGCAPYGTDIDGTDYEDMSGTAISLSWDGTIVSVAAPGSYECEGRPYCGNVRAFEFGFEGDWVQLGQMIQRGMGFGMRIQLSLDGKTLAAYNAEGTTEIYRFIDGVWRTALERPIVGTFLAMSYDASVLAVEHQDGTVQMIRL
jgi:hypothetical protein